MQKRKDKSCECSNLDVNHLALGRHEAHILTDVARAMVLESHLVTQDLNHRNPWGIIIFVILLEPLRFGIICYHI